MNDFQKQAIAIALREMFEGNHFNICTVDKCLKISGVIPPTADYEALSALHCVYWNKMPDNFRQQVFVKTLELFTHTGFPLEQIMVAAACNKLQVLR
jgi:hypothetical protein